MGKPWPEPGPFRVDQLREGDRYELENGHAVYCAPSGGHHGKASVRGARALGADPAVEEIGFDVGYASGPTDLRAPDISIGNVPDADGWATGVPRLAVEYAGRGQDEDGLKRKVQDLLARGTELVWVARLVGPRRVEVFAQNAKMRIVKPGETLDAPGILLNPVPVDALFDEAASLEANLRGLLERHGYSSLDEVRDEGRGEGRDEGARASLERLLERRFGPLPDAARRQLSCASGPELDRFLDRVLDAESLAAVFAPEAL